MKEISKLMFLMVILMTLITSCNNEEIFEEQILEEVDDTPGEEEDNGDEEEDNEDNDDVDATQPCDFTLVGLEANSTVTINCILDLDGSTITLPTNVIIEYEGGDIINGTLNFSGGGVIDGNLLNSTLSISGSNPQVKDPVFEFIPSRWGIVEGRVSDEVATNNRDILESSMSLVKNLGVTLFKIDALDAYFKVDGRLDEGVPELHAINIPGDFNLEMTSNTNLRMQPHGHFRAVLLSIYDANNVTVTGGVLHGDREEHDYDSGIADSDGSYGSTHEWVDVMRIKGAQNITIDGVTFADPAGDGLNISGIYHYYDSRHVKSQNITIKNSTFLRARRTNLVITSGEQIFIEYNEITDGGIDMQNSTGIAPSSNLNFEPVRGRDSNGNLIEYEHVSNIYIRNNTQSVTDKVANPRAGGFQISHGEGPIVIENNEMINTGVSFYTANGVIIRNNNIVQSSINAGAAENFGRVEDVFDNEIYGNTVVTDNTAINIVGNGTIVRDNSFEGSIGMSFGAGATESSMGASNMQITNNTIKASNRGMTSMNTMQNVVIENNTIDMLSGSTFAVTLTNAWDQPGDANFVFKGNTITGTKSGTERGAPPCLVGANSITIENNLMGELQFNGGSDVNVINNEIEAAIGQNGVLFNADVPNTSFDDNEITVYPSQTPLNIDCVKVADNVTLSSTTFENQECIEK